MKIQWFNLMAAIGFLIYAVGAVTGKPMAIWEQVFVMSLLSLLFFANVLKKQNKSHPQKGFFEIKERLSDKALQEKLKNFDYQFSNKKFLHKNGGVYRIVSATTINQNGTSYWGLIYRKDVPDSSYTVFHTRPLYEFLDGRFKQID